MVMERHLGRSGVRRCSARSQRYLLDRPIYRRSIDSAARHHDFGDRSPGNAAAWSIACRAGAGHHPATPVALSAGRDERREMLAQPWRFHGIPFPPIPTLIPLGVMWGSCIVILIAANDLGASLLLFSIFLTMIYLATNQPSYVILGLSSFAVATFVLYQNFDRIAIRGQNWLDPWVDPLGIGYQQIQSDYAISSGGVFGSGFAQGQPWRIPAVHTDYVFSAIGEELGLLGTTAVVLLLLLISARGMMIALRAPDGFSSLLAGGLSTALGIQTLIILGGVTRLIPLTGITLPFVSYGGSSLLTNFVIAGILLAVSSTGTRTERRTRP